MALIDASLILHYSFDLLNLLPDPSQVKIMNNQYFQMDYTFFLNLAFLAISGFLIYLGFFKRKDVKHMKEKAPKSKLLENILKYAALLSYVWLAGGLVVKFFVN